MKAVGKRLSATTARAYKILLIDPDWSTKNGQVSENSGSTAIRLFLAWRQVINSMTSFHYQHGVKDDRHFFDADVFNDRTTPKLWCMT